MNILMIEPFYSGSHKHFSDQLKKYSRHNIELLTLEGRFWKWRMYGAAQTLAQMYLEGDYKPDLILVTDMLDLTVFLSTVRKSLPPSVPIVCYFHENQMAYPWQAGSEDKAKNRDLHYGMMNYHTAMAADWNLFNSAYNMNSLYDELESFLKKMPDNKHTGYIDRLREKSSVMPLGLELTLKQIQIPQAPENSAPLILWNHRWEHDKNPDDFFSVLLEIKNMAIPFRLAVLGESYKSMPVIFKDVPELFKDELIHYGYGDYETYLRLLNQTDLLPVTSNHDFFGISIMEAVHCGATPLLPKRLTYPELYDPKQHPELFYDNRKDLVDKLADCCQHFSQGPKDAYRPITEPYDWSHMIHRYDDFFDDFVISF